MKVDIDFVINSAFSEGPTVSSGSTIQPARNAEEQVRRLLQGIDDCSKSPEQNPDCGKLANHLSYVLKITEQWDEARSILNSARLAYEKFENSGDTTLLKCLVDISNCYATVMQNLDRKDLAVDTFRRALELSKRLEGDSVDTLTSMNNFGDALIDIDEFGEARAVFEAALSKLTSLNQDRTELAAKVYNNLGFLEKNDTNFEAAKAHYLKAIDILQSGGFDEFSEAGGFFNLGRLEFDLGNNESAKEFFENAQKIGERILPSDHPLLEAIAEALDEL